MMTQEDVSKLISTGKILEVPDETLDEIIKWAAYYSFGNYSNPQLFALSLVNFVQNQRHLDKIQKKNDLYSTIIIVLTSVSIILSILSFFINHKK
jgi:hypothetical protein